MLSRVVVLAAALSAAFALIMGAIRAQPYDDRGLRAFFLPPEGCPAPCFMGIRPGVTTVEEAVDILSRNQMVAAVYPESSMGRRDPLTRLTWDWVADIPDFVERFSDSNPQIFGSRDNGVVNRITLYNVNIAYGDFILALNAPYMREFGYSTYERPHIQQETFFPGLVIHVTHSARCSRASTLRALFFSMEHVNWYDDATTISSYGADQVTLPLC